MKKIYRYLKLRKLKSGVSKEIWEKLEGNEFLVWYDDGTTDHCLCKQELYHCLEKDHIKPIRYVFDMTDRIIVSREAVIDTNY